MPLKAANYEKVDKASKNKHISFSTRFLAFDASTSLGGGKAKTEARARARLRWDPNAAWPHICCNRTNRVNNTDLPATMTRSVFSKNAEASSKGKKFDTPTRVSRQKEAATDANLDDHGAESKR
uniref:Uncharacterized protein n=1 Tax=Oryza sativa subsp. japonica TaxID=39947 RepID=Q6Z9S7_ORYSJ|nr:hypothetical protein [Oryza sativa Japonica Group]BAD09851.1 hypothetical protein [Oryza sativa Japonica Group]